MCNKLSVESRIKIGLNKNKKKKQKKKRIIPQTFGLYMKYSISLVSAE
jgi:hypothetical protein